MTFCDRAKYYRIEYQEARDFNFIASFIEHRKQSVLELPCGAGRLSTHLASVTDNLTIVDFSKAMIDEAKYSLADANCGINVVAYLGDMRTLELHTKFDLIIVPREALQLVNPEDARMTIQSLIEHLVPKTGRLILDLSRFIVPGDPDYFCGQNGKDWKYNWTRRIDKTRHLSRRSMEQNFSYGIRFIFEYTELDSMPLYQWSENFFLWKYDTSDLLDMIADQPVFVEFWGGYNKEEYITTSARLRASITRR